VGEEGDEVRVARFIADQRTSFGVPHAVSCRILGISISWFYKWINREPTVREQRREELDAAVRVGDSRLPDGRTVRLASTLTCSRPGGR
jgi:hypothetical protein